MDGGLADGGLMLTAAGLGAREVAGPGGFDATWDVAVATLEFGTLREAAFPPMPHHTLVLKRRGVAERRLEGGRAVALGAGDIGLVCADEPSEWRASGAVVSTDLFIHPGWLARIAAEAAEAAVDGGLRDPGAPLDDPALAAIVRRYVALAEREGQPPERLEMDAAAVDLALALLRGHAPGRLRLRLPSADARVVALQPWRLKRVEDFVDAYLEQDLRLEDLARVAGQSVHHFARTFKAATGVTPAHWLKEKRLARAKALLQIGDAPLAEVGLACGFCSQAHFTTAFRLATGVTPAAFRRDWRR